MAGREIKGKLSLENEDYVNGMKEADDATSNFGDSADGAAIATVALAAKFESLQQGIGAANASMGKLITGLQDTIGLSEEQAIQFRRVKGSLDLMEAPLGIAIAQLRVMETVGMRAALVTGALTTAAISFGLALNAVNAQTDEQRKLFSALTGLTVGLTATQVAAAYQIAAAKTVQATATWELAAAEGAASAAATGGATAPLIIGAIAAIVAAIATYKVSSAMAASKTATTPAVGGTAAAPTGFQGTHLPSAETGPGDVKQITKGGAINMHDNELVMQPETLAALKNGGGVTIAGDVYIYPRDYDDFIEKFRNAALRGD